MTSDVSTPELVWKQPHLSAPFFNKIRMGSLPHCVLLPGYYANCPCTLLIQCIAHECVQSDGSIHYEDGKRKAPTHCFEHGPIIELEDHYVTKEHPQDGAVDECFGCKAEIIDLFQDI